MQNAYEILINKLSAFTQKYYQNLLLRGLIVSFSLVAFAVISFALLEHFGRFSMASRSILFWTFSVLSSFILVVWVLIPILKLIKLGKRLSDEEAAKIIGKHFPLVADKLLNVIQLKQQNKDGVGLLEASINQKALNLKPIPFVNAVNFLENKRYLKYALIPVLIFGGFILADSEKIITESSARILDYKTAYVKPAPFVFTVTNEKLECVQNENFTLSLQLEGEEIPTDAYIDLNGLAIKMTKRANHQFDYTFNNIQSTKNIKFNAGGLYSNNHKINVLAAPSLTNFSLKLTYPNYTQKKKETLENVGEVLVPEGTKAQWLFSTANVDSFKVLWGKEEAMARQVKPNEFSLTRRARETKNYTLLPFNEHVITVDSVSYLFKVIKDGHPIVDVSEVVDSTSLKIRYFKGEIKDDYGFSALEFVVNNTNSNWDSVVSIAFDKNLKTDEFFFIFDMNSIEFKAEDALEYYFKVSDNDAVNGAKTSRSRNFEFQAPSKEELQELQAEKTDELKNTLENNVELAKEIQEEFEELRKKLLDKKELNWEDRQKANEVLEKQKQLEKNIDKIAEKNREKNAMLNEFSEEDKRILEKQKQLQDLMDELMTEDMRELFDEMEKLMEEMKTDEWMEKLEELQLNNEDLEKELDRNLELLKKFEFEQSLEESLDALKELKEKQEQLQSDNLEKTKPQETITEEQEKLNEEFQKLSEKLDDLQEKNSALEKKENLQETKELQESIAQDMQESKENSEKKKRKKTAESQKQALDKMDDLEKKLEQAKKESGDSGPSEDMDALRQILENLIDLSIDEEELLNNLAETNKNDPEYVSLIHWQNKLSDDSKILEDSLYALSKRQMQIKATINREMSAITTNFEKSLANMAERQTNKALEEQQLVMTSANNLALMLSDVLQSMQEDLANKTPGEQQCSKPGSGNPKPSDLKKMQQKLKEQLEKMKKGKDGEKGKKPKPKTGQGKDLAKMMGRQEMIRKQLEKMAEKIEESENGNAEGLRDAIKNMEKTEEDIANNSITQETLNRQNQIIEQLLKAENAEQERDKEEKREAKEADQIPHQIQNLLEDYKANKLKQAELLKTIPPKLRPYYKEKVKDYFQKLEKE